MSDTATRLHRANEAAQAAFHDMLSAGVYPDRDHPLTRRYVQSERLVDSILVDAQWEKSKAELDAVIAAADDDRGNHYLFPEGVIEGLPEFNGSFR